MSFFAKMVNRFYINYFEFITDSNAYACVEGKGYQIANKAQDFQFERAFPSLRLRNMEIDETTDREIARGHST